MYEHVFHLLLKNCQNLFLGWDPYANVSRPIQKPGPTVFLNPAGAATYVPAPPAYSSVIAQNASNDPQAPPPSYASTMVLDATRSDNQPQQNVQK